MNVEHIYLVNSETQTVLPLIFGDYTEAMIYRKNTYESGSEWVEDFHPYKENIALLYF